MIKVRINMIVGNDDGEPMCVSKMVEMAEMPHVGSMFLFSNDITEKLKNVDYKLYKGLCYFYETHRYPTNLVACMEYDRRFWFNNEDHVSYLNFNHYNTGVDDTGIFRDEPDGGHEVGYWDDDMVLNVCCARTHWTELCPLYGHTNAFGDKSAIIDERLRVLCWLTICGFEVTESDFEEFTTNEDGDPDEDICDKYLRFVGLWEAELQRHKIQSPKSSKRNPYCNSRLS